MKYNTGYSFVNLKVLQDFQVIYVKEFSFKSHRYCSLPGFEKEKQGMRLTHGARGSQSWGPSNSEVTARHLGEEADAERG